jgi:outer membrane protein OmpA-like peptidoglycan-associated protein
MTSNVALVVKITTSFFGKSTWEQVNGNAHLSIPPIFGTRIWLASQTMKCILLFTALSLIGSTSSYALSSSDNAITFHGRVVDLKSHALVNASVDVFHNSDFIKESSVNVTNGEFIVPIKNFGWYIIAVSSPGYVEATDTIWVVNERRKLIERSFYLAPIEVGLIVALNNVYFDFGKDQLSEQSFPELDKTIDFFKQNSEVRFEIGGHTDSQGPDDYNLILSQARAQAVVDYLVSKGVNPSQLVAHGYGETKPIDPHKSKEAEAKNRRVEFKVLNITLSRAH